MAFGVLLHRRDSVYDDDPATRYQFPPQYLERARAVIGQWIIYLEPSKVSQSRGYFAAAKIQDVVADQKSPGMYRAVIEPGSYLDFPNPVPFCGVDGITERGVLNAEGRISGRAQAAVRPLSPMDFSRIVKLGLDEEEILPQAIGDTSSLSELSEQQEPFQFELADDLATVLTSRVVRDRAFRQAVLKAYDSRCAITGLRLINGGGAAEVEAAHIRPVEAAGPDSINNGLALSGTAHWMFDRGLLGIEDDLRILISRHVNDASAVASMINHTGHVLATARPAERPHNTYLRWHRENCFKG